MTHTQGSMRMLKIKTFFQKEKGPCAAAAEIDDLLAVGVGNRVCVLVSRLCCCSLGVRSLTACVSSLLPLQLILYHWNLTALVGKAFWDSDFYIVSVQVNLNLNPFSAVAC